MSRRKHSRVTLSRHLAIIEKFDRLVRKEKAENEIRADFLPKQYYVYLISKDPRLGLSKNYISKIINRRYTYDERGD